jgi:hypothetical protein
VADERIDLDPRPLLPGVLDRVGQQVLHHDPQVHRISVHVSERADLDLGPSQLDRQVGADHLDEA